MEKREYGVQSNFMQRKRDTNIDLLKIIASIAVVGLHTLGNIGLLCGFAVPAFILSSGYLLLRGQTVTLKKTILRICRILKVVLLWNLLWLSFPRIFLSSPGWSKPWLFAIIGSIGNSLIQNGIWQFWYFGTLIILYVLLLLSSCIKRKLIVDDDSKILYVIWGIVAAFGFVLQYYSLVFLHFPAQSLYIQTFRLWTWIQYFTLGGILYRHKAYFIRVMSKKTNMILLFLLSILSWLVQYIEGSYLIFNLHAEYFYDDVVILVWVFLIALFILRLDLQHKVAIAKCARLTLGVYIIHPFLIEWYVKYIRVESLVEHLLAFLIINTISFFLSAVLNRIPIARELVSL